MKIVLRTTIGFIIFSLLSQPMKSMGQERPPTEVSAIIKQLGAEKNKVGSFQAFGVRVQSGPYFTPDVPMKDGKPIRNDYSPTKLVYIAFHQDHVRISERNYSDTDATKEDPHSQAFFSAQGGKNIYHDKSGFHNVYIMGGGRYVYESARITLATPPQTLGFCVPEEFKWPDELLSSGRYHVVGERSTAKFGRVIEIEGKKDNDTTIRFSVAPERSCRIVESQSIHDGRTIQTTLGNVVKVDGVWVPSEIVRVITHKDTAVPSTETWTFDKVSVNDVKQSDVQFHPTIGDHNHNLDNEQHSYTIGDNQRKYVEQTVQSPYDLAKGWLYMASVSTLLVLTVAGYVKWKRKQLSKQV